MDSLFSIDLACANPEKGKQCSHKVMLEENPKTTSLTQVSGKSGQQPICKVNFPIANFTSGLQPDLSLLEDLFPLLGYCWLTFLYSGCSWIVAFRWADVITLHLVFYACKSVLEQLEFQRLSSWFFSSVYKGNFGPKLLVNIYWLNCVYWNEFCLFLGDYWTEEHSVNIACLQVNIGCL